MKILFRVTLFVLFITTQACAQNATLSKDDIDLVVAEVGDLFEQNYVFPKKGEEVKKVLLEGLQKGRYQSSHSLDSLSAMLKKDIISVTKDLHVNFVVKKDEDPAASGQAAASSFMSNIENFGLTKVEVLEGNIGLLKIDFFFPIAMDQNAAKAASEAMKKFEKCDALIIDLRTCKGGSPEMLNYLFTYFYPEGSKIHLNNFYYRPDDDLMSTYTLDEVPGKRLSDARIFVLTSKKTFSCGEEFAYDMKHLERGTLVGEVTGGAAHPVQPMNVNANLQLMVPTGRAINPITKTNWEGVGVIPHIEVDAANALEKAMDIIQNQEGK